MQNSTLLISGAILSVVAAGLILFNSDDIDENTIEVSPLEKPPAAYKPIVTISSKIEYDERKPSAKSVQNAVPTKPTLTIKKPEKPLPLGSSVYSENQRHKIELFDQTQLYTPSEAPIAHSYVSVQGKVDGKNFYLKVPDYFIAHPENVKLRVTDSKTKRSKTIPASFLYDLAANADGQTLHHVDFESSAPENFQYYNTDMITPPDPN